MIKSSLGVDQTLAALLRNEEQRQQETISLIASENYASPAVLTVMASVLTNKYAEGYPQKRYYAGCEWADAVEQLAIDRCKKLFGVEYVNVQPHAGCQANMAVYQALIKPGDTILGMSLAHGGHLTHGHPVNFSGLWYKSVQYGVDQQTECIDYDQLERLAYEHMPKIIVVGASAYSRIIDFERCAQIAKSVNAYLLADIAHIAGLIAAGVHPSPVGYADVITSTTHKTLRGPRGGLIMTNSAEIADRVNRAIIPGTQGGPFMHAIAAKAAAFYEALKPDFVEYQKNVVCVARYMAEQFAKRYRIVSGGTDNHLFIVDLTTANITGLQAQNALEKAGIIVSRSCIPFDPQKPWITSGIRIGSPALVTRGIFKTKEIDEILSCIFEVLDSIGSIDEESVFKKVKERIKKIGGIFTPPCASIQSMDLPLSVQTEMHI